MILSGGSGSRLWPVSRESYPKQFCDFFDKSFLRDTIERIRPLGQPHIVTLESMGLLTKSVLQLEGVHDVEIVLEPFPKNTAPATALMVYKALLENKGDEVMGIFPADHLISQVETFRKAISLAQNLAEDHPVVTMGIEPSYPATGYGYLELTDTIPARSDAAIRARRVHQFVEKPDLPQAEKYVQSGNYFWNAGIFIFKVRHMAQLFEKHMPDMWRKMNTIKPDFSNLKYTYANVESQSLDYGVMEKIRDQIVCVSGDYGWSDVGSWDELARLQEENLKIESQAQVVSWDAGKNFVYSNHGKVVGLCGVNQLIVVDTPDALLVARRGESQNVRKIIEQLRQAQIPQASEHVFEVRPWGKFEVLADAPNHKVKRLLIEPGQQLSYQVHEKRDEHWVVISGEAEILIKGKKAQVVSAGQQISVLRGQKHRISNKGRVPLTIIEVQTGSYFGEDDIVRIEDDYNRT